MVNADPTVLRVIVDFSYLKVFYEIIKLDIKWRVGYTLTLTREEPSNEYALAAISLPLLSYFFPFFRGSSFLPYAG